MRLRGRVGLASALAASACAVLAPSVADAGLIAALSTDRAGSVGGDLDVFLLDPASTSINLPPAGVNTSGVELGVSLTADGSRLGFTSAGQTFLVDRSNGQRASIPPEGSTAGPNVVARRTGAVSPNGTEFVTGSQRNDGVSSVFVFDVTDLAAVSQGARVRSDLLENEDDAVALDPVVADNGRLAWIENPPIVPIPQRADQGTIGFATGSTLGRPILRPANSTLLASEPTIKPLPTKAVSVENTAITFTRQPGRLDPRVDLGVVVMDGDPGYELLSLPGVSLAGEEMLPTWSGDGRYLAFVAVSAERRTPSGLTLRDGTLKVYDTLTQALVNPAGRSLGTKHRFDSLALARTAPLIVGFAIPNTTISPAQGAATLAANLSGPTNVGILVQRITGMRRLFSRRVPRLRNVGRVPLGGHRRGRSQIPWSLRVNGRRLAPGRYQITLRALRGSRVTDLSKPVTVRVR